MTEPRTLPEQGCRLVWRAPEMRWAHPVDMLPGDIDCTDLNDEEFEAFVRKVQA